MTTHTFLRPSFQRALRDVGQADGDGPRPDATGFRCRECHEPIDGNGLCACDTMASTSEMAAPITPAARALLNGLRHELFPWSTAPTCPRCGDGRTERHAGLTRCAGCGLGRGVASDALRVCGECGISREG